MDRYTLLEISEFDRIAFAHSLVTEDYRYELANCGYGMYGQAPSDGGILEIGFVEENGVLLKCGTEEITVDENSIFVIPPDSEFDVSTFKRGVHRHTSVEFLIRGRWKRVGEFELPDEKRVVLPLVIPPCQLSGEVFQLIRRIAIAHNTDEKRTYFEECADFMGLIHKLGTVASFCEKKSPSPAGGRYCRRAKDYVSLNIDKKLTVKEIAEYVGVSRNYLTNLFTANEGVSLIEYVNRRKLAYMVELIRRYGYTLQQAGLHVGFTDVNYISRIFRQYYGMTFVEFKRTELGIKDK